MIVDVDAEVLFNRRLSEAYNVVGLAAPGIAAVTAPGQFVMIRANKSYDPLLRRPFSVFEVLRAPDGVPVGISILNKMVGAGTRLLYASRPGDRMACLGPLGTPFTPPPPPAEAWIVAGGVGLAPFATLCDVLCAAGTRVRLFYGARTGDELFCLEVFDRPGITIELCTEDGSRGSHGRVTVPLESALAARDPTQPLRAYACGPTPMMRAVAKLSTRFSVTLDVSLEQVMGCGLGGCYSCVVQVRGSDGPPHFVRSCLAGPVFNASDLEGWGG